jgi:glycerol uptake facilitator-like aquaporin
METKAMNANFIGTLLIAIVGLAVVAVLVSKSANTGNVFTSAGTGFASVLNAATSPVTGQGVNAASTFGITSQAGY